MKTPRPESKPSAAAEGTPAAAEAKAEEERTRTTAPETPPAPGEVPSACSASTPPAVGLTGAAAGAKAGEGSLNAPETLPAPSRYTAGPETNPPASGPAPTPAFPTARLLLPAGAPEDAWHAVRRAGVGGSDVAAILGMDPHRGPLGVWNDKCGSARPEQDQRLDRSARRGHRLEGLVAEFFAEDTGCTVIGSPGTLQHVDHPHWIANPDRIVLVPSDGQDPAVLECKTRTWRSARIEGWRGVEPPDGPSLQAHWYLTVSGYRIAYLAGLLDDELVCFRIERDDELCQLLAHAVDEFWQRYVMTGIPPTADGSAATARLLSRMWEAKEDSTAVVDPVDTTLLLARRRSLSDRADALEEELTAVDSQLKANLGEAEVALMDGRPAYTWRQNGNFAAKAFRQAEPELAAVYTHLAPRVDVKRLAKELPDIYRKYRARRFYVPSEG